MKFYFATQLFSNHLKNGKKENENAYAFNGNTEREHDMINYIEKKNVCKTL